MVQGRAATVISRIDTEALLYEVDERYRLVALRSHMNHIHAAFVLCVDSSAIFHKKSYQLNVAVKRREVKCCERIVALRLQVHPIAHFQPSAQFVFSFRIYLFRGRFQIPTFAVEGTAKYSLN